MLNYIINIAVVVLVYLFYQLLDCLYRCCDQGCCKCKNKPKKTSKKSIQEYIDLYGGTDYDFFYRQIFLVDVVAACCMYGQAIPPLMILGFINLFIFYVVDKHALMKFYRRPPNYRLTINNEMHKFVRVWPLAYFALGFWMFSNRQIFGNNTEKVQYAKQRYFTNHHIQSSIMEWWMPGYPFLIFFILVFALQFESVQYWRCWNFFLCTSGHRRDKYHKEPDYQPFFSVLSEQDKWRLRLQEQNMINLFNNERSQKILDKLDHYTHKSKCRMVGLPFYDIMQNADYRMKFEYVERASEKINTHLTERDTFNIYQFRTQRVNRQLSRRFSQNFRDSVSRRFSRREKQDEFTSLRGSDKESQKRSRKEQLEKEQTSDLAMTLLNFGFYRRNRDKKTQNFFDTVLGLNDAASSRKSYSDSEEESEDPGSQGHDQMELPAQREKPEKVSRVVFLNVDDDDQKEKKKEHSDVQKVNPNYSINS